MSSIADICRRNNLLNQLSDAASARLHPHLSEQDLILGDILIRKSQPFTHVYFVTQGIVSVIAKDAGTGNTYAEVGNYGFDGMGSTATVLGCDSCPYEHVVQVAGKALYIPVDRFTEALRENEPLASFMRLYVHSFNVQTSYTAVANANYGVVQRLARWLLMCEDRVGSTIDLTHDFMATMLSVHRPSVTEAVHVLEGEKLIWAERGRLKILDRMELENRAGLAYGLPESEYRRLIGPANMFNSELYNRSPAVSATGQ